MSRRRTRFNAVDEVGHYQLSWGTWTSGRKTSLFFSSSVQITICDRVSLGASAKALNVLLTTPLSMSSLTNADLVPTTDRLSPR